MITQSKASWLTKGEFFNFWEQIWSVDEKLWMKKP